MKLFLPFATVLVIGLHSSAAAVCFPDRATLRAAIAAVPSGDSGAGFDYAPYGSMEDWCFDPLLTDFSDLFRSMPNFNAPIGQWDTSSVTDMNRMFFLATAFDQNLDDWDTSSVTDMSGMFFFTNAFDQPVNSWNTSSVTNMGGMFFNATAFNQPLDAWDTSSVTTLQSMFKDTAAFNQPLNAWDVSSVTDMGLMFGASAAFNQPLDNWDVSSVTDMGLMFSASAAFNQSLCVWGPAMATDPQPAISGMFLKAAACESKSNPAFPFTENLCTRTCPVVVPAADTCPEQAKCIEITTNQLDSDKCSAGICEFEICLTITGGLECAKAGTWARTCQKPENVCLNGATGFEEGPGAFSSQEITEGIDIGFDQCQTVSAGETVEFLLKDGGGCGGTGGETATINTNYGDEALCAPSQVGGILSCANEEQVGNECIWRTVAPSECEVDELCE